MVQSHTLSGRNSGVECLLPKQDVGRSNRLARSKFPSGEGDIPSQTSNWVFANYITVNKSVNNSHVTLVQILPPRPLPVEHVGQVCGADL